MTDQIMDMYYNGARFVTFHAGSHDATYTYIFTRHGDESRFRSRTWAFDGYPARLGHPRSRSARASRVRMFKAITDPSPTLARIRRLGELMDVCGLPLDECATCRNYAEEMRTLLRNV